MSKKGCQCVPKKGGCAHYHSGICRLLANWGGKEDCVMRKGDYHYLCCPFLNNSFGQGCLKQYNDQFVKKKGGGE